MNTAAQLIETIRIQNGRVRYIDYHNARFNASRKQIFGIDKSLNLRNFIHIKNAPQSKEVKCRITYDAKIRDIEYEEYKLRSIQSLKPTEIGDFEYKHKYKDRSQLLHFYTKRQEHDDILMTKNGYITDTYYANVALQKNEKWYTPKHPLLAGTQRARLIQQNKIIPKDIHIDELQDYTTISIFNSMIPFKKMTLKIQ